MFENSILPIKTNIFLWIKETKGELTKNLKLINGLTKLQYHFTVFSFFLFLLSSSAQQTSAYWKLQHFQPRWRNMERLLRFMNRFAFWQVPDCIPAIWKLCASKVFIRPYKPNCTIWKLIYQIYTQTLRFQYSLFISRVLMVQL